MPALLIRTWTPPHSSLALATISAICSYSVTLPPLGMAVPPAAPPCPKIGRAHVRTPVTNAHLVCRLLLEKKKAAQLASILRKRTNKRVTSRHKQGTTTDYDAGKQTRL